MSSHSWHYSHSHSHNWHSRTFSIAFRFWLLWIERKYSSDPLLWWWWPIQSYLHTWIYEYQSSRTRVGQVIPPRSKVRTDFCSQKSKSGLVKGFVSIVGPVPPYGRRAKRWDHGAFIQFGQVLLGFFSKCWKEIKTKWDFLKQVKRSKGKVFAYLAFLPYPNWPFSSLDEYREKIILYHARGVPTDLSNIKISLWPFV